MSVSVDEAVRILSRYDTAHYTPKCREAHRMAIKALKNDDDRAGCRWCSTGNEVCATCERFFAGLVWGCCVGPTGNKCSEYVPANYCVKCGRRLRSSESTEEEVMEDA